MASTRQSMVALRMANSRYLVLLLCLLCVCRADSTTSSMNAVDAHHAKHETIAKNTQIHGDNDTYQHILTRLKSWMKEKRKNDKQRNQLYDDDDDDDDSTTMARPFVTLAFAQTLDGMIAAKSTTDSDAVTSNLLLSCPQSTILTHHLRNVHDAILVGGSTFLADQPRLNVRLPSEQTPSSGGVRHPIPIILDTNLKYLQRLIFGNNWEPSNDTTTNTPPEIMLENIRAHHPVICCSAIAAQAFLDILEISFQEDDDGPKRKRTKSYKIFVYKKIDDPHHGHKTDNYMPIKITIHVITTHHNNRHKHDDDDDDANTKKDITLTLLPCRINKQSNSLDLRHVLSQLYNQVDIESVMVEGGAGVLSSFLNECVLGDSSTRTRARGKVVDCICVTIAPQIIGGKWGLPVLGKFDIHPASDSKPERSDGECGIEEGGRTMLRQGVMTIKEGEFLSLGQDGTFLGRI